MSDWIEGKQYRYGAGWGEVGIDHYSRGDGFGDGGAARAFDEYEADAFSRGHADGSGLARGDGFGFGQCLGASHDLGDGNG